MLKLLKVFIFFVEKKTIKLLSLVNKNFFLIILKVIIINTVLNTIKRI